MLDEGRKRAQARGVKFGRKPALAAHQRREALSGAGRWGALSLSEELRCQPLDNFEDCVRSRLSVETKEGPRSTTRPLWLP
jgi:hypothetical protein